MEEPPHIAAARSRREFLREALGVGVTALGAGLFLPEEVWAGVEERAARFGITPGTAVDAQGRPKEALASEPFIGEIMIFAGNFAPLHWAFCNGQLLGIASNTALFSILGTTYGGDGETSFALPNLQGRMPMQWGNGPGLTPRSLGEQGGAATVTLAGSQLPPHIHTIPASSGPATMPAPTGAVAAVPTSSIPAYAADGSPVGQTTPSGGGQPHGNLPPYLVLNFIIALQGIFPPRP